MDIGFVNEDKWFRLRACAVIVRGDKILMCKNEADDYYYSVGGAVKHGESLEEAVIREVFEETGVMMEVDRLLFINENFFNHEFRKEGKERYCHETAFYFLMRDGVDSDLVHSGFDSDGVRENTEWLSFDDFKKKKTFQYFIPEILGNTEVKIVTTRE